ncbi:MAG: hypothetical protein JOZ07_12060 [Solirubrobacterales bacterium]|nr:hypothetical protein [Solirubrobacterales bacterium]
MDLKQEDVSAGHLQVIGDRGSRRWRAFWWDADGKHFPGAGAGVGAQLVQAHCPGRDGLARG